MSLTDSSIDLRRLAAAVRPIDDDLRTLLARYVDLVRRLTGSALFAPGETIGAHLEPTDDGFEVSVISPVSETELTGTAATFRQLWMHGERYTYVIAATELRKHAASLRTADADKTVHFIDELGTKYKEVRRSSPGPQVLEATFDGDEVTRDGPVRAEDILNDWLHGELMHSKPELRERLGEGSARALNELVLLTAIQDMTRIYVNLARLSRLVVA